VHTLIPGYRENQLSGSAESHCILYKRKPEFVRLQICIRLNLWVCRCTYRRRGMEKHGRPFDRDRKKMLTLSSRSASTPTKEIKLNCHARSTGQDIATSPDFQRVPAESRSLPLLDDADVVLANITDAPIKISLLPEIRRISVLFKQALTVEASW
jgi:hypothetical protein